MKVTLALFPRSVLTQARPESSYVVGTGKESLQACHLELEPGCRSTGDRRLFAENGFYMADKLAEERECVPRSRYRSCN